MNQWHALTPAKNLKEMRIEMQESERITSHLGKLSGVQKFDEEAKISKLKTIVPPTIHNFIAQSASNVNKYEGEDR